MIRRPAAATTRRQGPRAAASTGRALACCLAASAAISGGGHAATAADEVHDGRLLLAQYQCGRCHVIPGVAAARGRLAAPLDAFGARSYIAGRLPNDATTLARWIIDPPSLVPGTAMPNLGVSADDARRMAAYLGSLR